MLKPQRTALQSSRIQCYILQQISTKGYRDMESLDSQNGEAIWDVKLWERANSSSLFEGSYCLHFQGQPAQKDCLTVKMKTVESFKTSATIYPMTQHHAQHATIWHWLLCGPHRPSHGSDSCRPLATKVLVYSKASTCGRQTGIV